MWFYILMPLSSSNSGIDGSNSFKQLSGKRIFFLEVIFICLEVLYFKTYSFTNVYIQYFICATLIYRMIYQPHCFVKTERFWFYKQKKWGARLSEDRRETQKTTGNERKVEEENTQSVVNFIMVMCVTESSFLSAGTVSHLAALRFWLVLWS